MRKQKDARPGMKFSDDRGLLNVVLGKEGGVDGGSTFAWAVYDFSRMWQIVRVPFDGEKDLPFFDEI